MNKPLDIGNRLKQLRGPLSQKEFAEKLKISWRALQNYEAGKRIPKGDVLYRIAAITNMPVNWILGLEAISDDDLKEQIRHDLWIEGVTDVSQEDIERLLVVRKRALAATAQEEIPKVDPISKKILILLKDMSEERKREVLKYAEEKKLLMEVLGAQKKRGRAG